MVLVSTGCHEEFIESHFHAGKNLPHCRLNRKRYFQRTGSPHQVPFNLVFHMREGWSYDKIILQLLGQMTGPASIARETPVSHVEV